MKPALLTSISSYPTRLLVGGVQCLMIFLLCTNAAYAQPSNCTKRPDLPANDPYSNGLRSDRAIADAVSKALQADPKLSSTDRTNIVLSGIFGPCFSAMARPDQFEIVWMRNANEQESRSADIKLAVTGMARAIRLFKVHNIQIEGRPSNVHFIRFKPGTHVALYTVHWTYETLNRALAAPDKAEPYLWKMQKVAIGEPPLQWMQPHRARR